jgi:protein-tyrosine phosphatase
VDSELQGASMKEVFWIGGDPSVGLAIVLRPRGNDWLEDELLRMRQNGIEGVVSMLEQEEADSLGLCDEAKLAEQIGLAFLSYPIPDRQVPNQINDFNEFVKELANRSRAGERIGIHCRGSIGRASIATACTLIHLGWEPEAALSAIAKARGCPVPDTEEQREWIRRYKALP